MFRCFRDRAACLQGIDLPRVKPELLENLEEHLYGEGVSAVEWAERLPDELRDGANLLRFQLEGEGRRVELHTDDARIQRAASAV